MGADEIPGLPGAEAGQTVQVQIAKQVTHTIFMSGGVTPLADGGVQVTFIIPTTGEALHFPLNEQAAEELGKQLLAPRVAVANGDPGKLRSG